MRKIYFIINPISGGIDKQLLPTLIQQSLNKSVFEPTIIFTEYPGHAKALAQQAIALNIDVVVAVGGDGTINEIASQLVNTSVALGIIPNGSGNGLARHLGIPLDSAKAIQHLNYATSTSIDVGKINDHFFFCTSGIGFDAHVSSQFARLTKRGFWGYFKTSIKSYLKYKPATYQLNIDGKSISSTAFLITFANASQFGNNAHIAPLAHISDGLLDVCIMRPFRIYELLWVGVKLFSKTIHKTDFVKIVTAKNIVLTRLQAGPAHFDGEPVEMPATITISILPKALKVLV